MYKNFDKLVCTGKITITMQLTFFNNYIAKQAFTQSIIVITKSMIEALVGYHLRRRYHNSKFVVYVFLHTCIYENISVGLCGVFPGVIGIYIGRGVAWHTKKGGLRCGNSPKRGLLGAGTAPKKGVLGTGKTRKGGFRHVYNPKKLLKRGSCELIYVIIFTFTCQHDQLDGCVLAGWKRGVLGAGTARKSLGAGSTKKKGGGS